jgi:hypothetical protein
VFIGSTPGQFTWYFIGTTLPTLAFNNALNDGATAAHGGHDACVNSSTSINRCDWALTILTNNTMDIVKM